MDGKPLRKDAERNREALLCSAHDLFAERGLDVGLNEIARVASVGVGTAYRHFPDKEDLVDALFARRLDEIAGLAARALEFEDAWEGIETLLQQWLTLHLGDRALTQLFLDPRVGHDRANASRDRIAPLLNTLADRAREQGRARVDFAGSDIFFIQLALIGLIDRSRESRPTLYRRYLAMLLEGARSDPAPGVPLVEAPLDVDETHAIVTGSV